jgi:hypothetical protein
MAALYSAPRPPPGPADAASFAGEGVYALFPAGGTTFMVGSAGAPSSSASGTRSLTYARVCAPRAADRSSRGVSRVGRRERRGGADLVLGEGDVHQVALDPGDGADRDRDLLPSPQVAALEDQVRDLLVRGFSNGAARNG